MNVHSIKTKLILAVLAVMTVAFLFQFLVLAPRIEKTNVEEAQKAQEAIADQLASGLEDTFRSAQSELESMARLPEIRSLDRQRMDRAIAAFNASNQFFNYYFVMDQEGCWLSYPTRPELVGDRIPRKNMDWVNRTFNEKQTVFLDVVQASIGTLVSGFSTPICGADGRPAALLRGVITVSEENTLIRLLRNARVGQNGFACMISSNGWLLAHPRTPPTSGGFERFQSSDHVPANAALSGRSGIMTFVQDGKRQLIAFRPVSVTGWAVLVQQPMEDITAAARNDARMTSLTLLSMFGLTLLVTVLVIQVALRPLAAFLRDVEAGRARTKTRNYPRDEIGQLARRFDELYTDLYASREKLGRSEEKFRALFNNASDGVVIHDLKGRILEVNRALCDRMGYDRQEFLRLNLNQVDSPATAHRVQQGVQDIREKGHLLFESEHVTRDGRILPVEIHSRLMDFEGRKAILSVARDLSERKEAEQALRESEEKYRLLVEKQQDLVVKVDIEGRFLFVSPSYCDLFGMEAEDLIGRTFMPLVHEEDRQSTARAMEALVHPPHTAYVEQRAKTRHGWRWLAWKDTAILDDRGEIAAIHGLGRDITDQKTAEQALRLEKERFQALVEESPFGLLLVNTDLGIGYVNPRFVEDFAYTLEDIPTVEEWMNRACPDPAVRWAFLEAWETDKPEARSGRLAHRTFTVTCRDGTVKDVHFRFAYLENGERLIFLEDITDRKRLEAQFQQSQKMEALGTLAGGIAHDFNNLLMGIQGRASLLLTDLDLPSAHKDHLRGIETYVKSASDLTKQLLGIARGGKVEVKPTDVNQIVQQSAEMFGRTHKEIRIHFKFEDGLPGVEMDQRQIEQVLLNLFVNAWQAMPAGGELYLETEGLTLDAMEVEPHDVTPGRYVRLSVTDTGVGMDKGVLERIFEPFFTTKGIGRGTGLGLASAYGIIKNHNGFIRVYSERGQGSTFTLYLPASSKRPSATSEPKAGILRGSGLVLLVDDEEMILEVGAQMLRTLGYDVLLARSGEEAVRWVLERTVDIDLVVLDMIMPDQGGGETFDRLKALAPDIRVILSSGYSLDGEASEILKRGCRGFIQKPFNLEKLSQKIAEALKGEGDGH